MAKGKKTGGRTKGTPNKITADVKAAIVEAFHKAGGVEYLETVAKSDPRTFCALLGRVMPLQISGEVEHSYVARLPVPAETASEWHKQHAPRPTTH